MGMGSVFEKERVVSACLEDVRVWGNCGSVALTQLLKKKKDQNSLNCQ